MKNMEGSGPRRQFIPEEGNKELTASELEANKTNKKGHRGIGKKAALGVLTLASFAVPGAQASMKEINAAKSNLARAELNLKQVIERGGSLKEKQKAEQQVVDEQEKVLRAEGIDIDEQRKENAEVSDPDTQSNIREKDSAVSSETESEIRDNKDRVAGSKKIRKLSPKEIKHRERMARIEAGVKKKQAEENRPRFTYDGYGGYGGGYDYGGGGHRGGDRPITGVGANTPRRHR